MVNETDKPQNAETLIAGLQEFRDEVITKYPKKVARKRAKSIVLSDAENTPQIQANVRTIPGIITQRG
ncbi:MAG: nitrogenase molybdenum-iron protein alpha chain, partial [Dysgonamonadaceae bacterium]|nr:nitrogenase molybdenum-iron protein alpha chain [Dysgonamonadaceae bacterium]